MIESRDIIAMGVISHIIPIFPKKSCKSPIVLAGLWSPPPKLILKTCFLGVVDPQEQHLLDQKRNGLSHFRIKFSVGRIQLSYIHSTTFHGLTRKILLNKIYWMSVIPIIQRHHSLFSIWIIFIKIIISNVG